MERIRLAIAALLGNFDALCEHVDREREISRRQSLAVEGHELWSEPLHFQRPADLHTRPHPGEIQAATWRDGLNWAPKG